MHPKYSKHQLLLVRAQVEQVFRGTVWEDWTKKCFFRRHATKEEEEEEEENIGQPSTILRGMVVNNLSDANIPAFH